MPRDITVLENQLASKEKSARIKAVMALLVHPNATPLHIAKCFCSQDFKEILQIPGMADVFVEARKKLKGVEHPGVYRYVSECYRSNPENLSQIVNVLTHVCSPKALEMLERFRSPKNSEYAERWIDDACRRISHQLKLPFKTAGAEREHLEWKKTLDPLLEVHATREQVIAVIGGSLLDMSFDKRYGYEFDSRPELFKRAERYPGVLVKVRKHSITHLFFDAGDRLQDYYLSAL